MTENVVISGTGVFTPKDTISNDELVASYNAYVDTFNEKNKSKIDAGEVEALKHSTSEFIEKASGIKSRHVFDKKNILDPEIMRPFYADRTDDEISHQAEMAITASKKALEKAKLNGADLDAIIFSSANTERAYPAIAIEIQEVLEAKNAYSFDMQVACSSMTFGISQGELLIKANKAKRVLVVTAELIGGQLNFADRDSHFIFGEACVAAVLEREDLSKSEHPYRIIDTELFTKFSSNIRNNFGFLHERTPEALAKPDKAFYQQGRRVFKDIVPLVPKFITKQLEKLGLTASDISRLWLHQANTHMNELISSRIMGRDVNDHEAPIILDRYANTGPCGSVIAFDHYHDDLHSGDYGVLCSFGAGYSIGSIILQKV